MFADEIRQLNPTAWELARQKYKSDLTQLLILFQPPAQVY